MKRIASVMILAILICQFIIFAIPSSVNAESLYVRKIVSVVYDDSGSMYGDKWAYANYAMQSFCGMMNSEDKLFITYMSDSENNPNYEPYVADLSSAGIQSSVDSIRDREKSGRTPYGSIQIAMDKLKSTVDTNPNTQYWLVIITDGVFSELTGGVAQARNRIETDLSHFVNTQMPNGTAPQVTYLSIGGEAIKLNEKQDRGIFSYHAESAADIIGTMSGMADRISGRTRLKRFDIKQLDSTTLQLESAIPLLNIVLFFQQANTKVSRAIINNEQSVGVSRDVYTSYPNYDTLEGGINVIGDSNSTMAAGTYKLLFDKPVDLDDIVILFEPALEIRMTVSCNGRQIDDYSELDKLAEDDEISVSFRIFEMGTDNEIDPSLLPPDTSYRISISEDGHVKAVSDDGSMALSGYKLGNGETELSAAVEISGFNPIEFRAFFTPSKKRGEYSVSADYGSSVRSVKFDHISTNKELSIVFSFFEDGDSLTDIDAIKFLDPKITIVPDGNGGSTTFSSDGKLVFTPNSASLSSDSTGSLDVNVTCTLNTGPTASLIYTVVMADFRIETVEQTVPIVNTELFNNSIAASFYVTKDGARLNKSDVEGRCFGTIVQDIDGISLETVTADDGSIVCTPSSSDEHKINVINWWVYWSKYLFKTPHGDMDIRLSTPWGDKDTTLRVEEAPIGYRLLNVYLPMFIELALLATLITWIVLVLTKPRFVKGAKLYVGEIRFNTDGSSSHILKDFRCVNLDKFNRFKYLWKFKRIAEVVSANGIDVRADHGGRIICEKPMPWYKDRIKPVDTFTAINSIADMAAYCVHNKNLIIEEFSAMSAINNELEHAMAPAAQKNPNYIVIPDSHRGVEIINDRRTIRKGRIIIYTVENK